MENSLKPKPEFYVYNGAMVALNADLGSGYDIGCWLDARELSAAFLGLETTDGD